MSFPTEILVNTYLGLVGIHRITMVEVEIEAVIIVRPCILSSHPYLRTESLKVHVVGSRSVIRSCQLLAYLV